MIEWLTYPDHEAVSQAAVALFVERFNACKGTFAVALSGGHTPGRAYELLGEADIDWSRVQIYWVDDRYVPPSDPESNEGLVRRTFLDKIKIPAANVHPMYMKAGADISAEEYAKVLAGVTLDFCFMGVGPDGHTASLFPGDDASMASEDLALHTYSPIGVRDRVTMSLTMLRRSQLLVFLESGADKFLPLQRIRAGENLPATVVAQSGPEVVFLVDETAAGV